MGELAAGLVADGHVDPSSGGAGSGDASTPIAYDVGMRVKVGPVSARFAGRVTLSDLQPPQSYRLAFEGQGGSETSSISFIYLWSCPNELDQRRQRLVWQRL